MSTTEQGTMEKVLDDVSKFSNALKSALPLEHFSQFYEEPQFDKLAKQKANQVFSTFQKNSKLSIEETMTLVSEELLPRIQEVIRDWKAKNEENRIQCNHYLQNQVDFLLSDFRTTVMIKLISAPDVGLQELEAFLERKKTVLIGIFEKLSKPGGPRTSVRMKTRLDEGLEHLKMETLEKQRLQLEQKASAKANKSLEDAKGIIMKKVRELKTGLVLYQRNDAKDLVKGKLIEINCYLSKKGKALDEFHPNIYSALLKTTKDMKMCLDQEDFETIRVEEFARRLHEQLLFDFVVERQVGVGSSSAMELDSMSSRERNASATWGVRSGPSTSNGHDIQLDFVEEEGVEEGGEDEVGQDECRMISANFKRDNSEPNETKMKKLKLDDKCSSHKSSKLQNPSKDTTAVKHSGKIIVDGITVWICPACGRPDDASPMIGCDGKKCESWYHFPCVGIIEPPESFWNCRPCRRKYKKEKSKKKKNTGE